MHRSLFQTGIAFPATPLGQPSGCHIPLWNSSILNMHLLSVIVHMHGCGTCQMYQLHTCCTCSAELLKLLGVYRSPEEHIQLTPCSMTCIRLILIFLYKISWMKAKRNTGKSERISQIPVRKMAGMSFSTTGSVIPLAIHTHYKHTTWRSWDKYTLQAISIYRLFILKLGVAYLILRPSFSVWDRISAQGLLA